MGPCVLSPQPTFCTLGIFDVTPLGILVRGFIVLKRCILLDMERKVLEELGIRISEKRKIYGWTQEDLASKAGIDRSYIGSVERGERNLTFKMLCKICSALRCDVAELAKGLPESDV